MRNFRYIHVILLFAIMTLLASCSNGADDVEKNKKMTVMASFYTLYEFTKNIAQDKVNVELLVPVHMTPHDWDPAPKDMKAVQDAELFVYSSEHFETWITQVEQSLENSQTQFVHVSEGISLLKEEEVNAVSTDEQTYDPHVWLSPILAQKQVENIASALIEHDPDHEQFYADNRDQYIEQLQSLDEEYRETLSRVSKEEFITEHAAFGYLAKEYGLTEIPIAGLSPSLEPSAAQLVELKKLAKQHEITTIFYEDLSNAKAAETLANEIGADVDVLSTLEGLTKEQQDKEYTYIDLMRFNLKALEKSLQ